MCSKLRHEHNSVVECVVLLQSQCDFAPDEFDKHIHDKLATTCTNIKVKEKLLGQEKLDC